MDKKIIRCKCGKFVTKVEVKSLKYGDGKTCHKCVMGYDLVKEQAFKLGLKGRH